MHLKPARLPFGPQEGAIWRGQFIIWPRVEMIMLIGKTVIGQIDKTETKDSY